MSVSTKTEPLLPPAGRAVRGRKRARQAPPKPADGKRCGEVDPDALYDYVTETFPLTIAHLAG